MSYICACVQKLILSNLFADNAFAAMMNVLYIAESLYVESNRAF